MNSTCDRILFCDQGFSHKHESATLMVPRSGWKRLWSRKGDPFYDAHRYLSSRRNEELIVCFHHRVRKLVLTPLASDTPGALPMKPKLPKRFSNSS
ncbi:hypothetical protein M5689_024648 [Euphorbia peplus]|nr:hypothetical protein M5689_024648 [Euphorbia peplus]